MPFLIGIDEAGYGPNLGPLVISASAWRIDGDPVGCDLYERLAGAVSDVVVRAEDDFRVAIADSKQLYKPGDGLAGLEYGLFAALRLCDRDCVTWRDVWETLAADTGAHRQPLPWYDGFSHEVPIDADRDRLPRLVAALRQACQNAAVCLETVKSLAVFPRQFNQLVELFGSKGAALTRLTLELLGDVIERTDGEPTLVVCDKHGGRNRYADQLQEHFPEYLVEIHGEARAQSVYRWGPPDERIEIRFQSRGESFLPAALASMASKYLRELAMLAFNDYWRRQKPDVRATAGYPLDAKRFKADIAELQKELQIDDEVLWRSR
jgi:hypothetical protein